MNAPQFTVRHSCSHCSPLSNRDVDNQSLPSKIIIIILRHSKITCTILAKCTMRQASQAYTELYARLCYDQPFLPDDPIRIRYLCMSYLWGHQGWLLSPAARFSGEKGKNPWMHTTFHPNIRLSALYFYPWRKEYFQ